jgi:bifunctional DNase/RNase
MLRRLVCLLLLLAAAPAGAQELTVERVEVRLSTMGAVVLLRIGNRAIPVFVDPFVAQSIQGALGGEKYPRPLPHDLMHDVIAGFGGKVSDVVVTLHEGVYYAALTITMGGTRKVFDSRSSDAIALAVHGKAPIRVSRELLEGNGIEVEEAAGAKGLK